MTSTVKFDRWEDSAGNGIAQAGSILGRNCLYNGAMAVAQRGTSFTASANNDDVYTLDRWILLSDGNDVVDVTQSTDGPTGFAYSVGLDVETANKKFGIFQVLENKDSIRLESKQVTLSFYAKTTGSSISDVKAVVLSWSSTADSVTSDVVSAWNSGGTVPTFATNWTAENTPANLSVSSSWARYSVTATVDTGSMANVGVFIWCDDASTTVGDFLYVTGVQLEVGGVATGFEHKSFGQELAECQRYFISYPALFQTASNAGLSNSYGATVQFPVTMRGTPTVTVRSVATPPVSGQVTAYPGGVGVGVVIEGDSNSGFTPVVTGVSTYNLLIFSFTASLEL